MRILTAGIVKAAKPVIVMAVLLAVMAGTVSAQEQSRESMAVDATASQWSFQFAGEGFWGYKDDYPKGNEGFLQFRMIAPIGKSDKIPFTMLPRLTLRSVKNKDGEWGFGSSDIFVLGIAQEWATGRWGIGPQVNFPAKEGFGNTEWGYGLAGAVTQRAMEDKMYLAFLLQQTWSKDPVGKTKATPIGINLIIVYQLGNGWYIGNGDFVMKYSWDTGAWFIPFGVRLGKAFVGENQTWNAYVEYAGSLYYDDWPGPVAGQSIRVNVQYQIPVGF